MSPHPVTPEPNPECTSGSIIECQGQVLREAIPITGTPYTLWYSSREQLGNSASRTIRIPMTDVTLPPGAQSVLLEVSVLGQRLHEEYAPAPSLYREFTWDGTDAYGRPWQGTVMAEVRLGFSYRPAYLGAMTVAGQTRSFAAVAQRGGGGQYSVIPGRVEPTFVSWATFTVPVSQWDARGLGLGGWTISEHGAYDRTGLTSHKGDGTIASATDLRVVEATAGDGQGGWTQDPSGAWLPVQGYPATDAIIPSVKAMAVAPDGSLVFIGSGWVHDGTRSYIWRLGRDGRLNTVAGRDYPRCDPSEGVPASTACVGEYGDRLPLAIGLDASIYFTAGGSCGAFVRRISPDGIVRTVIGSNVDPEAPIPPGMCLDPAEGIPAANARFGPIVAFALAPDGDAYFAEDGDVSWWPQPWPPRRIWRVGRDGLLRKAAGFGSEVAGYCNQGADDVATYQFFRTADIAIGPDGNLYVADENCNRVRRLTPDGIITTVAGGGAAAPLDGDGGKATSAVLRSPVRIAFTRDGSLYILESRACRIRMVSARWPHLDVRRQESIRLPACYRRRACRRE